MSWAVLLAIVAASGFALAVAFLRRSELERMERSVRERGQAARAGDEEARLQHPVVDLSRCLGCATCVAVCPEDGVLEVVHGQAMVVRGARCQGISACERSCPVGAITVTIANLESREDVPALTGELEAVGAPGIFLAGEVTAHALIKTAVEQGTAVAAEVARRIRAGEGSGEEVAGSADAFDLVIVGAGPAGLACSLEAKRQGLHFLTIDQESEPGGTVARYPRRKLVLTQPVDLPLRGRMARESYTKEELVDTWRRIAREESLPIRGGETFVRVERDADGRHVVVTKTSSYPARNVCLALGRRGSPRRLGVPGEDLPKVAYSLLDASSYQGRRVLVVGGGDAAVEAAMGLAEQPGTRVSLSYRKETFFRIRPRNEERLRSCVAGGKLELLLSSRVLAIHPESVEIEAPNGRGPERLTLPNDEVFVLAGGVPPVQALERAGVSFDPDLRPREHAPTEQGTGLLRALGVGFALSLATLVWALLHADYYLAGPDVRPTLPEHRFLRPGMSAGLFFGVAAAALVAVNLLYLLRRSPRIPLSLGSLQAWMTSHVATGILAFLLATLHAGMAPRATVGGRAYWALLALLVTGAIGRYFYAYVPRAANGRELELDEVKKRLERTSEEWDRGQRRFRERVRAEVALLVDRRQWKSSFASRVLALLGLQLDLRRTLRRLADEGAREGIARGEIQECLAVARKAHRTALMTAHFEDLRAVLATWRYLHRWIALLMVLLVLFHVGYALAYGSAFFGRGASP